MRNSKKSKKKGNDPPDKLYSSSDRLLNSSDKLQNSTDRLQNSSDRLSSSNRIINVKNDFQEEYSNDQDQSDFEYDNSENSQNRNNEAQSDKILDFLNDQSLLATINAIGSQKGLHFDDFYQTVQNDSLPRFVTMYLNITIDDVNLGDATSNLDPLSSDQINNIQKVINYLKTVELKFKVLLFDFQSRPKAEISAKLFYSNFLNLFFLKSSKAEMYERCGSLLCSKLEKGDFEDFEFYSDLCQSRVYLCLLNFLREYNFDFEYRDISYSDSCSQDYFAKANVAKVINRDFLDLVKSEDYLIPTTFFYQLQLIFDAIDNSTFPLKIIESFMSSKRKLRFVKVPRIDVLLSSIKSKRISIDLQKQTAKTEKKKTAKNKEEIQDKKITAPKPFSIRFSEVKGKENVTSTFIQNCEPAEKFWNLPESNYELDNGILYEKANSQLKRNQMAKEWAQEMSTIQYSLSRKFKSVGEILTIDNYFTFSGSQNISQSKLYKIFFYDESEEKWCFDSAVFEKFAKNKGLTDAVKTPVALFVDSFEDDIKAVNTYLINGSYPSLESHSAKSIFVYAFCDKNLSKKSSIKPIFMQLHVPKIKGNLPNIKTIVTQIYSFLSLVCDFEIVFLNKKHVFDQINFLKTVKNISESISPKTNMSASFRATPGSLNAKNPKMIFLINDPSADYSPKLEQALTENKYFKSLLMPNKECRMIYINSKESSTFHSFLSNLNELVSNEKTILSDIESGFKFVELSQLSNSYIKLKTFDESTSWKEKLKKIIRKRCSMLEAFHNDESKFPLLLDELKSEIEKICPKYDSDFLNESNLIISGLKSKDSLTDKDVFALELEVSALSHLSYLNDMIHKKYAWSEEQMDVIQNSHARFLKKEFMDILKNFTKDVPINTAFAANKEIVENQIKIDASKITEMFKPFVDVIKLRKSTKDKDINRSLKKGTNYILKESEVNASFEKKVIAKSLT